MMRYASLEKVIKYWRRLLNDLGGIIHTPTIHIFMNKSSLKYIIRYEEALAR